MKKLSNMDCFSPKSDLEFMQFFNDGNFSVVDINIIYKGWLGAKQFLLTNGEVHVCRSSGEEVVCLRKKLLTSEVLNVNIELTSEDI